MAGIVDIDCRAIAPAGEYDLIECTGLDARIEKSLAGLPTGLRGMLTPPVYYSLARGIADNRAINDALLAAAAKRSGWRAFGVAEPKYGEAAFAELERIAGLGAAGVVWSPRAQGVFGNDHSLAALLRDAHGLGLVSMIHSAPYSVNEGLWRLWALAAQCPGVPLVLLGACESWENIQQVREHAVRNRGGGGDNLFYGLSMLSETWDLDGLAGSLGAERLLFGSGGADLFERTLGIVERSSLGAEAKDMILSRNAKALFQ